MKYLVIAFSLFVLAACSSTTGDPQQVVDMAIKSHGFNQLIDKEVSFTFRKKQYAVQRNNDQYVYKRAYTDSTGNVEDVLVNSSDLRHKLNAETVQLTEKQEFKIKEAVNSVLYFFQLPLGLNDQAVNKQHIGSDEIKGKQYHLIKVTFRQEGGGTDFQDEYLYWIGTEDYNIDYLAYNYIVNGGGVRFREAINRRTVSGMVFQDYVNYKPADKKTPLEDLSRLFEEGQLKELSRIISQDIKVESLKS